jgi:hypothetical protein
MQKYCVDAWSATDLILNPKALVKKREEAIIKSTMTSKEVK